MAKVLDDLRMTVAEFVRWHDGTDVRHELIAGHIVAMAPPTGRHAILCRNVFRALDRRLVPPCGPVFDAGVSRALDDDECRVPDVFVTCEPVPEHIFSSPRLIVEVLSPSTEKDDRTVKLDFYKSLEAVQAVLLVWQDQRRTELHTREGPRWPAQPFIGNGTVPLLDLGAELPLDEIYAGVELPAEAVVP